MKSFFIVLPVGGGRSRKLNDRPLVALRYRRCSSECDSCTAGDWDSGNAAFALSRGSCRAAPSASSSDPRFSDMLFSPPAFRLQVNRMTQEHPSGLLLTESGIQHRVPRRTVSEYPALQYPEISGFRLSASRLPNPLAPVYLSPFAMWLAFPTSDYYGDSVALGLASRRQSWFSDHHTF